MLLAGIGVAFTWVLLSLALGVTASPAHAEDDSGLLGGLTSTVEDAATAVTDVVEQSAAAVVESVIPVVDDVVEPVAALPVAPAVDTVDVVVERMTTVVVEVTEPGVVTPIVDAALGVVDAIPVVDDVVSALGVDSAASSLGSSVDGVLKDSVGVVTGTVTQVVDSATDVVTAPVLPAVPPHTVTEAVPGATTAVPGADSGTLTVAPAPADAAAGPLAVLIRAGYAAGATAWFAPLSEVPGALSAADSLAVGDGAPGSPFALLRSVLQADSAFVGSGGAGPGAWALVALGLVVAHRAWVRRSRLEDEVAPPAPVLSTDVSPD